MEHAGKLISVDFDKTLSRPDVQEYIKSLISLGVDVWVITSRYDDLHAHLYSETDIDLSEANNDDLWEVIDKIGLPRWKVRFTCFHPKHHHLSRTNIIWHLDDDHNELFGIKNNLSKPVGIQVNSPSWKNKCNRLLGIKNDMKDEK